MTYTGTPGHVALVALLTAGLTLLLCQLLVTTASGLRRLREDRDRRKRLQGEMYDDLRRRLGVLLYDQKASPMENEGEKEKEGDMDEDTDKTGDPNTDLTKEEAPARETGSPIPRLASGDVVRLRSGGPDMTVAAVVLDNDAPAGRVLRCEWFDRSLCHDSTYEHSGAPRAFEFYESQLERVPDDRGSYATPRE